MKQNIEFNSCFFQRYKTHISSEQKDALLELLKHQSHYQITPEIRYKSKMAEEDLVCQYPPFYCRRELMNSTCRDVEMEEPLL